MPRTALVHDAPDKDKYSHFNSMLCGLRDKPVQLHFGVFT